MKTYLLFGLVWLSALALLLFVRRGVLAALWREPMLRVPVVIVESDDWGVGPASDGHVLRRIAAVLKEVGDALGHPAVMTLGVVAGSPDGQAIVAGGCEKYTRVSLLEPRYAPIVEAMRDGCAAGVFAIQRHGLEHCWPAALLARARRDKALARWLMEPEARSEALPAELQSRWVDASELPSRPLASVEVAAAVDEEARLLELLFGRVPPVAVPNTFVWDDVVERAWAASGVRCIVTPGRRYEGRDAEGKLSPPTRVFRNGQRNAQGVCFVVRDAYFEPSRGHRAEDAWRAVAARSTLARPTLLETHRGNFIDAPAQSETALAELARTLRGVVARHADVCFMSTETLVRHFDDPESELLLRTPLPRLAVFLRRVGTAPELRRTLRWLGLGVVLAGLARVLTCSVPAPRPLRSG